MALQALSLWIAGASEDGAPALGRTFLKACARSGLHAFGYSSVQAVRHGGHVLFQASIGPDRQWTQEDSCDILLALNRDALEREAKDASWLVVFDPAHGIPDPKVMRTGVRLLPVEGLRPAAALGLTARAAGLDLDVLTGVIREMLGSEGEAGSDDAAAGWELAGKTLPASPFALGHSGQRKLLLSGDEAVALGALAAGCRFFSAPAGSLPALRGEFASRAARLGVVVEDSLDAGSAAEAALGAAHTGARALCAFPGSDLPAAAAVAAQASSVETPLVLLDVQRAGPSVGLPTKTEQGDLLAAIGGAPGDHPRVVLAPTGVADAFAAVVEAFNLAERHQIPVLILSDVQLSSRLETVDSLDLAVTRDRGEWARAGNGGNGTHMFQRYAETLSGVSPRSVPGQEGLAFVAAPEEHDASGHSLSGAAADPYQRIRMMDKRGRKPDNIARELQLPRVEGPRDAPLTLVGWGSTYNLMRLVMEKFNAGGIARVNLLCIRSLWPFPFREVAEVLYPAHKVLAIEGNASGQLCRLIRMETGFYVRNRWLKYDGEPFYPGSTFHKVQEVLQS